MEARKRTLGEQHPDTLGYFKQSFKTTGTSRRKPTNLLTRIWNKLTELATSTKIVDVIAINCNSEVCS